MTVSERQHDEARQSTDKILTHCAVTGNQLLVLRHILISNIKFCLLAKSHFRAKERTFKRDTKVFLNLKGKSCVTSGCGHLPERKGLIKYATELDYVNRRIQWFYHTNYTTCPLSILATWQCCGVTSSI